MVLAVAATTAVSNKRVILKRYVMTGLPTEHDMEVVTTKAPALAVSAGSSVVVVKNLYISCDPYMRNQMIRHETASYVVPDFVPGQVLTSYGVMKVISSGHPDFKAGDLVWGVTGWEEYTLISNPEILSKINHPDLPLSYYIGIMGIHGLTAYAGFFEVSKPKNGIHGLTAYAGFFEVSKPKKGEYVFVSAACGAIGQIVGQLAKIIGCYVVGSVGSDEKVNLLKHKFGFNDAFNYNKEPDLEAALKRCFPQGIDIYFENVGGATLDAMLPNMRLGGRITVCGMISQYNLERPERVRNLFYIITKRLRVEGFLSFDYNDRYCQFEKEMAEYLREEKVIYMEDIAEGLDAAPAALVGLFTGRNIGKQLVAVVQE